MSDVKSKVHNIIAATIAITLIIAVFSIIYLGCQKNPTPILTTLTLIGSFVGAGATLVAAYVASLLYSDWRKPMILEKISIEQKDIYLLTRKMKRNIDTLLLFLRTQSPSPLTGLNNGDEFSLKYQHSVNNILDDLDDLCGLVTRYKSHINPKFKNSKIHLDKINTYMDSIVKLYDILAKPNPILGYIESYNQVKNAYDSKEIQKLTKDIIKKLPDELSHYYSILISQ